MAIKRGLIAGQLRRVIDADLDASGIDFKELLARTVKVLEVNEVGWYNDLSRLIDAALAADKGGSRQCSVRGAGDYRCTLPPNHGGHFHVAQGLNDREIARWPVGEYREP
jgi:hypothetical protein